MDDLYDVFMFVFCTILGVVFFVFLVKYVPEDLTSNEGTYKYYDTQVVDKFVERYRKGRAHRTANVLVVENPLDERGDDVQISVNADLFDNTRVGDNTTLVLVFHGNKITNANLLGNNGREGELYE